MTKAYVVKKLNKMRLWLINQCCFCICCTAHFLPTKSTVR